MCGALSESLGPEYELAFARDLLNAVLDGAPRGRTALHVCRGNWTPDESVALAGNYAPLVDMLSRVKVGAYLLELCTPRLGVVLNWWAASALLSPPSTTLRTIASRPFGVKGAFL